MVKLQDLEVPEDVFTNSLICVHLKYMKLFGYIVSQKQQNKILSLRKGAIFIASFVVSCCLIFMKISKGFTSLAEGATSCATAFLYLSTSIATSNAFFQRTRVVRMVKFLHDDITGLLRITDPLEEIMLAKTVKYLRIITVLMWTPSLIAGFIAYIDCFYRTAFMPETVFNIPEVLNGTAQPILLFQLFPFGEVYDNFVVGYLGACYALFLGITVIPCWHTFVTCLMKYIVLKYDIIHKRLKDYDLAKLSSQRDADRLKTLEERELLKWHAKMCEFCVKEQINLRWFTNELQSLIKIPVFSDFIIFSVLICFLFYAIAAGNLSKMDYLFIAIYLFVMSFILWLYHWHATLIAECNDELSFALYSSPWYKFPVNVQKSIRLMMMESNTPLIMKAIFVELNLKTFIDVVRGAYSYFSILNSLD
ncbi:odorant receptor 56a [Lucilia sericata]|uniref:odorant receptor 56a n=1 Tax=Lucilia sericata TaxID=13632 RepID=UPI0018A81461|nr:odorant receptor 56a [Lucilia sericata]